MHYPIDRITQPRPFMEHSCLKQEIAQWVHHEESIWFIKGRGMYCSVYGKVHIKDPLLLIEKSSLCGGSGFPSKKCVNMTI